MNILLERLFESRGITKKAWEEMNDSTHRPLAHIDELCEKLKEIHEAQESIVVLPDFDMDGIMSGTLGYAGLSALGFDVDLFVPDPAEGYGFGKRQIDRLISDFPYADAIITCDTGIGCVKGVREAKKRGLKVLITDHHAEKENTEEEECSPRGEADIIVNPCAIDEEYDHPAICGAHVLWQVLDRFAEIYGSDNDRRRMELLRAFAGIGTISDTMPVLWENRELVSDAVEICKKVWEAHPDFIAAIDGAPDGYTDAFRGLYAAMSKFRAAGKLQGPAALDEMFFGFYMAPTFNSVKRMDGNMEKAFDVFMGQEPSANVQYLLDLNEERKQVVQEAAERLAQQENKLAPICYVSDALPGILGLLATRLVQENGYPCVVVSKNENGSFSGSGRSPEWFPMMTCAPQFSHCVAGHEGAFGCKFADEDELREFAEYVLKEASAKREKLEQEGALAPSFDFKLGDGPGCAAPIDNALIMDFIEEAEGLRPFGRGFEEPVAAISFDAEEASWQLIGHDKAHLKFQVPAKDGKHFDILCWGQAEVVESLPTQGKIEVIGTFSINEFRGEVSPQLMGNVVTESDVS